MILLAMALMAAADAPVVVSSLQTEQLADQCRGKDADDSAGFCTGYILGAFDTLSMARQICPSAERASTLKAIAVTRKYIRTHRKAWSSAPAFVVRDALQGAFPCQPPKPVVGRGARPVERAQSRRKKSQ
jgi:hypothetical protein